MNFRSNKCLTRLIFLFLCVWFSVSSRNRLILLDRTLETGQNSGHAEVSSAEIPCALAPPPLLPFGTSPVLLSSSPMSSSNVGTRSALQKRANLLSRRQQRYSREESTLATALRRLAEYERLFPPRPSMQYATKQLELRVKDAATHLGEIRELLRDDTTDRATHQALLRTRWMLERWISSAKKESLHACTSTGRLIPPDPAVPYTRQSRQDANLAYFFAHSPTQTATSRLHRRYSSRIEQPRTISKRNIEALQLRKWPLTTTLRAPMKLKSFSPISHDTISERSTITSSPDNFPSFPEQLHSSEAESVLSVSEPPSPVQATSILSSFPPIPDTPIDDSLTRTWPGFAVIYTPPQPSDEELLAALNADMEVQPMPEYVSYLLDQLEPIGEGLFLPGLSRRGTTTSSGFEFISRPSIEVYEYPVLPRSRLLVRRSMRIPPVRTRLGILSGLRAVCEEPSHPASPDSAPAQGQGSPRTGVFSKMRRSMTAMGHQ
jgi:hypothetical protein